VTALPRVRVISLGGTIAMTPGSNGVVPTLDAKHLIDAVPGIAAVAQISTAALRQTASANLNLDDVLALKAAIEASRSEGFAGCVVTQGTDTLEETAFVADLLLDRQQPTVFTAAMRHSGSLSADGPANLLDAIRVAGTPAAAGLGALVVMNGEIHGARFVRKQHTSALDAFDSDPLGPVGDITESRVHVRMVPRQALPKITIRGIPAAAYVGVYSTFGGDDGRLLAGFDRADIQGLVIEALGAGHVPAKLVSSLATWAGKCPVVYTSRVGRGHLLRATYGYPGGEVDLRSRGLICGANLSTLKARALLEVLLAAGYDRAAVEQYFEAVEAGH
jgi:L-asparaginase